MSDYQIKQLLKYTASTTSPNPRPGGTKCVVAPKANPDPSAYKAPQGKGGAYHAGIHQGYG